MVHALSRPCSTRRRCSWTLSEGKQRRPCGTSAIPDFATRRRYASVGEHRIEGRAWSGHGDVEAVDVSTDGGQTWAAAHLDPPAGRNAWRRWSFLWRPRAAGDHELCCRATDAAGKRQPADPEWNLGGYANNAVQRVPVTVR